MSYPLRAGAIWDVLPLRDRFLLQWLIPGDIVTAQLASHPLDAACDRLLKEQLEAVLNSLTRRERRVVRLRFGLGDDRVWTRSEVGAELHVSRETIRHIEDQALAKLRHPSRSRKLRGFLDYIGREGGGMTLGPGSERSGA